MALLLVVALIMIATNIVLSYLELVPFLRAIEREAELARGSLQQRVLLPLRIVRHLPKLIPCAIDVGVMVGMGALFSLGAGLVGGVTSLFASNIISLLIFYRGRKKRVG